MFKPQLKSPLRNSIMRALLAGNSTPSVPSFYFNFSNPSNVTLGAAQARGTITSTQNAHITMSASLSRVVGVAPLYVNIDMTGTTSTLITDADPVIQTARRNHELFYSVNWGDSGAGQWANGVQSSGFTDKNWSFGPVGGHVFETPGTYLVTPTSTDGVNNAAKPGYVTVLDPNVVYNPAYGAGYETICISHSNNFTGAPSGATQVNTAGDTDMYAHFNTYKGSGKRILFCKADSWTCSATMGFSNITNMTVGGYGTGVAATFGSGTMVTVTPANLSNALRQASSMFLPGTGCSDIKLCNLRVMSNWGTSGFGLYSTITQMLYYKVEFRGGAQAFNAYPGGGGINNVFDQHCMYECLADNIYGAAGVNPPLASVTGAIGTPGVFTSVGHPFQIGFKVQLTGTPPAPLATGTDYYISPTSFTANTFVLQTITYGDLALSGTGTCTATVSPLGGGIGAFVGFVRGGMMGCYFDNNNNGEQTVRLPFLDRAHISNNYIARPNQGKNILKIHSFVYTEVPKYSEKFIVSGNVIDMRGGYSSGATVNGATITTVGDSAIVMANGGSSGYEKLRNAIVESNITYGCAGNPKNATGSNFAFVGMPNITLRNNIADFSVGDRTGTYSGSDIYTFVNFATVTSSTDDPTTNVNIYNNTLYSNLSDGYVASFVVVNQPTNISATGAIGPGIFTAAAKHYMVAGQKVRLASGTPPAPLSLGVDYYVTATNLAPYTFMVSATYGGAEIAMSTSGGACVVYRGAEVDKLNIKNNVWYLPFHNIANPNDATFYGGSPAAAPTNVSATNNTSDSGNATNNPHFAVQPPSQNKTGADWRPTTGYAVSGGATVPVLTDFNMATRTVASLGAVKP